MVGPSAWRCTVHVRSTGGNVHLVGPRNRRVSRQGLQVPGNSYGSGRRLSVPVVVGSGKDRAAPQHAAAVAGCAVAVVRSTSGDRLCTQPENGHLLGRQRQPGLLPDDHVRRVQLRVAGDSGIVSHRSGCAAGVQTVRQMRA